MSMIPKVNVSFGGETVEFMEDKSINEFIKKEDATKSIKPMVGIWADDGRFYVDYQRVLDIINNIPSADVVEVRHGQWEQEQPRLYKCSACNKVCFAEIWGDETVLYDYCPNCGARMDGKEREHEHTD